MIPQDCRTGKNVGGNCVWCAAESIYTGAGHEEFRGVFQRALKAGWHGADMGDVLGYAKRDGVETTSQRSGGTAILFAAVRNGTGAYVQGSGHAMALVGIDSDRVVLLDNNPPSFPGVEVWSRQRFESWWEGAACYPTVNKRTTAKWDVRGNYSFFYRGGKLEGVWNDARWFSWEGGKYAEKPAPWTKDDAGCVLPWRRRHPSPSPSPGPVNPDVPGPNPDLPHPAPGPVVPPPADPFAVPPPPGVKPPSPTVTPSVTPAVQPEQLAAFKAEIMAAIKAIPAGKDGKDGRNGKDGADGRDGAMDPATVARLAAYDARIKALETTISGLQGTLRIPLPPAPAK